MRKPTDRSVEHEPERLTAEHTFSPVILPQKEGKGKGAVEYWAARVKPGRILFELVGVAGPLAAEAFSRAAM